MVVYLESGKMDDAVDFRVLVKHGVNGFFVCHVNLVEGRAAAANKLNAIKGNFRRVVETVNDDDIVAVLEKSEGGE